MQCAKCRGRLHVVLDNKETFAKSCSVCGNWLETPRVVMSIDQLDVIPVKKETPEATPPKFCPVIGCNNTMRGTSLFCRHCNRAMAVWKGGKQRLRPPVMEINGELWLRSYYDKTKGEKAA